MKLFEYKIANVSEFKKKTLCWSDQFEQVCYLDNNVYSSHAYYSYECLVAVKAIKELKANSGNAFEQLKEFQQQNKGNWLFGFLGYDLKNEIEKLSSKNPDGIQMPDMHFFIPEIIIEINKEYLLIYASTQKEANNIMKEISAINIEQNINSNKKITIHHRTDKLTYLKDVSAIRQHIIEGNVYELNYCQEFYAENCNINPLAVYLRLNEHSAMPFSCYYKLKDKYLMCASPERFLKKEKNKLISQPIKGTIKRGKDKKEDQQLKEKLKNDIKERAENVMIVDLVRNDLARTAVPGTVKVEELFGVYTYPKVHQMISTIVSELKPEIQFLDAIQNAFPMGSMTGAPKIAAMQLIEQYEKTKRGLYSGAVGYIKPDEDFDFNVVIRSILYTAYDQYLSFQVGGAITYDSVPEKEYEECLLKANAIMNLFNG